MKKIKELLKQNGHQLVLIARRLQKQGRSDEYIGAYLKGWVDAREEVRNSLKENELLPKKTNQ